MQVPFIWQPWCPKNRWSLRWPSQSFLQKLRSLLNFACAGIQIAYHGCWRKCCYQRGSWEITTVHHFRRSVYLNVNLGISKDSRGTIANDCENTNINIAIDDPKINYSQEMQSSMKWRMAKERFRLRRWPNAPRRCLKKFDYLFLLNNAHLHNHYHRLTIRTWSTAGLTRVTRRTPKISNTFTSQSFLNSHQHIDLLWQSI